MNAFDIIIIGAGINGCSLAYTLKNKGQKVLVLEKEDIASGGSGAAGAFINPKISKSGPLKELIEKAYLFALPFYEEYFPTFTTTAPLLHIAKYEDDNDKVEYFNKHTHLEVQETPSALSAMLTEHANSFARTYIKRSAIVEAKAVCEAMLNGATYKTMKVIEPKYKDAYWHIQDYSAKKLILCTGGEEEVVKEPYIKLRRIYGQRCEVRSDTRMPASIHHEVSVSVTKKNGCIAIGASHYLDQDKMPSKHAGEAELIALAQKSVKLDNVSVIDSFTGMRSGSNDYLPLLGPIVDSSRSIRNHPEFLKGSIKPELSYHPDLYMINGAGGYGFVLAPYLSCLLAEHIVDKKELPAFLEPKRFFYRWAKKEASL